jgi:hypothetical protein
MFGHFKKAARAVKDKVGDLLGAGFDKLKAPLEELSASSGELEKVGYRVGEIELECSLPPRIILHLIRQADATDEAFQAVLANQAGNRTFCTLVGLLRQTNRMLTTVSLKGRRLHEVEVGLGLIPSVRLKYAPA